MTTECKKIFEFLDNVYLSKMIIISANSNIIEDIKNNLIELEPKQSYSIYNHYGIYDQIPVRSICNHYDIYRNKNNKYASSQLCILSNVGISLPDNYIKIDVIPRTVNAAEWNNLIISNINDMKISIYNNRFNAFEDKDPIIISPGNWKTTQITQIIYPDSVHTKIKHDDVLRAETMVDYYNSRKFENSEMKIICEFNDVSAEIRLPLKPGSIFDYHFSEVVGGTNL